MSDRNRSQDREEDMHKMWYKGRMEASNPSLNSFPCHTEVRAGGFKSGPESKVERKGFKGGNSRV